MFAVENCLAHACCPCTCVLPMFALPNSHLLCWMSVTAQILISLPPDEFSCLAWTIHCQAYVRQQFVLPIFLDEPTAAQICVTNFSHCWRGCQYLRHCFGQPIKVWNSCTFDTVTDTIIKKFRISFPLLLELKTNGAYIILSSLPANSPSMSNLHHRKN